MLCICLGLHGKWQTRTVVTSTEKQTPGWAPSQLCCSPASESKHKHFLRNILLHHEELKCKYSRFWGVFCNFNSSPCAHAFWCVFTSTSWFFSWFFSMHSTCQCGSSLSFLPWCISGSQPESALAGATQQLQRDTLNQGPELQWIWGHSSIPAPQLPWGHVISTILAFRRYHRPES